MKAWVQQGCSLRSAVLFYTYQSMRLACCAALVCACRGGYAAAPPACAAPFDAALHAFHQGRYAIAAEQFYSLIRVAAAPDNPAPVVAAPDNAEQVALCASNFAWAHYFLGECLAAVKLHHAAMVYYVDVVKQALEPDVVALALARLQTLVQTQPFDTRLVDDTLLDAVQFDDLPEEVTDWLHFEQGRRDIVAGLDNWGDRHMAALDANSMYARQAQYVTAVRHVRDHEDTLAENLFAALVAAPPASGALHNQAQLALARMRFERGDYRGALSAFEQVTFARLSFEQGLMLTEKAWAYYYTGEVEQALGVLHALAAPSYENYFYPDTFLLQALIYKERCHFLAAQEAVRQFRSRFGHTFEQLRARLPQEGIVSIRRAAMTQKSLAGRTQLLWALSDARERVAHVLRGPLLIAHVTGVYDTAVADNDRLWRSAFTRVADGVATRLLDTQEQINLLDYAISLVLFRPVETLAQTRVKLDSAAPAERHVDASHQSMYAFDGEYWNDELTDYQVVLSDRCLGGSK